MLEFTLNNLQLVLDSNTTIQLTWYNPACYFDSFPGDFGLEINLPVNDTNRAYFGNPHRFEKRSTAKNREFPNFVVRFGGFRLMEGTYIIQSANNDVYKGWLRSSVGNLGEKHREKYIHEIEAFDEYTTFENRPHYDPEIYDYGCPQIFNPEFFYDKGEKIKLERTIANPDYVDLNWFQDLIHDQEPATVKESYETEALTEAFRVTADWFVNALNPDNSIKTSMDTANVSLMYKELDVYVVSPMLFLNTVLDKILKDAGFYINDNFLMEDDDLKNLILYNNYDITTTAFTKVPNTSEYHEWHDHSNIFKARVSEIELITRGYFTNFKYKHLIPKVKLKDFILGVQNLLNACFHFKHNGKVNIIDRETILKDDQPIDVNEFLVNSWDIQDKKDLTLKFVFDHDSDDTYFSERWEDIDDRRSDEKEPITDWSDLENIANPELGEVRYITLHNLYVQYAWVQKIEINPKTGEEIQTNTLGWEHIALGFQNGFYQRNQENQEEIKTCFSSLFGDQTVITNQRGNVKSLKYAYQNFTPRLLFYKPNNKAGFQTNNYSLDWEKEDNGLLKKRWPVWNEFWANRQPVATEANYPVNMLAHIIDNIPKKHACREGQFIVKKMSTTFNLTSIGTTKIDGFKI